MLKTVSLYLITFIISIVTGCFDAPASILMLFIMVCSIAYASIGSKNTRSERYSLSAITLLIYLVSSLITSTCFSEYEFYLASDPIRYIAMVHRSTDYSEISTELEKAYILLSDNNGLYNALLRCLGIICGDNGYEASALSITLPQTLFGILTIQTLFRILCTNFSQNQSYKYTLIYAICSLTLLYSGIIVRDVIIAFLFAICIETVFKPFSLKGIIVLAIAMLLCIGIRLFSGLFISVFIVYYVFFNVKSSYGKVIVYPFAIITLLGIGGTALADELFNQTNDEIENYSQWQSETADNVDGFSSSLRKLPPGISNIALALYSQMNPFPPYSTLLIPDLNASQIYMSCLMTLSAIWWFFISYGLLWFFLFKKGYKRLGLKHNCLLAIAWLLIFVSSTMHVDIRRLIPIYPIIYFLFLYCINYLYSRVQTNRVYSTLGAEYLALNILYLIIK